jgi:transposase
MLWKPVRHERCAGGQDLREWRRIRAWELHQEGWTGKATAAPVGQTPVLRAPLSRDHLSVISALTPDGGLVTHIREDAFRGPAIVAFLRQLLRQVRGTLLVIWDGALIHRCRAVKDFLAAGAAKQLHLERLRAYAPELNPDEGVWSLLKRGELKNRGCQDMTDCAGTSVLPSAARAATPVCRRPALAPWLSSVGRGSVWGTGPSSN